MIYLFKELQLMTSSRDLDSDATQEVYDGLLPNSKSVLRYSETLL